MQFTTHINQLANIIGIIGVIIILLTYFLLQANKIAAHKLPYPMLNLIGSCMILFSLFFEWNLPSVIVEGVWILISIYGIYKALK